jgi:hypothetical protein
MAPDHDRYGTQEYAGDRATRTHRTMQHMPDEDRSTRADLQDSITGSQAAELAPEVRMGDDRAIGDTPNWDGFDSQQLYDFATRDNSPTTADDLGRAFNTGGNRLADAANGLIEAVSQLGGAWTGVAADSARAALGPLAGAAGGAGQTAQMMGVQMSRQSVAANEVRKLPPPQQFDQQQSLHAMVAGGPVAMQADLKTQKDAADAVKREQISYLNAYTQAMSSVDARTPSFVPPPPGEITGGSAGDTLITGGPVPFTAGAGGAGPRAGADAQFTGRPGPGSGSGTGVDGGPSGGPGEGPGLVPAGGPGTSSASFVPPGTAAPGPNRAAPLGGTPNSTTAGPGGFGGFPLGATAAGGGAVGSGTSGRAAGGSGSAGGARAGGPGAGEGGRSGGSRGGVPAGLAGPGASGTRGGSGGTGGMGAGGGRRDGEDDDEHGRPSYLLEGDSESTFGSDQLAAPSVIGSDDDQD